MKHHICLILCLILALASCQPGDSSSLPRELAFHIRLKDAGNPSEFILLTPRQNGESPILDAEKDIPLVITKRFVKGDPGCGTLHLHIQASSPVNFQLRGSYQIEDTDSLNTRFLMPGFWYRQNLRSPEKTPSMRVSSSWMVREDRLSIPMTAVYDEKTGRSVSICRMDPIDRDVLIPYKKGEIILYEESAMGGVGFTMERDGCSLDFCFPFAEEPASYMRKLTLAPPLSAFRHLDAGEEISLQWEIREGSREDYSAFVEDNWNHSFDRFNPATLPEKRKDAELKALLAEFYSQSYTEGPQLKGFSGVHLHIDSCKKRGLLEVGFVGRVLLNAFNAAEYGYETEDIDLLEMAHGIFDSYSEYGFTRGGFLREVVDQKHGLETDVFSIRRQSEGIYAILQYLTLEKKHHRSHPTLEEETLALLDRLVALQDQAVFPRKFNDRGEVLDPAGGSTSTAIIPLLMGWKYTRNETYLKAARKASLYVEREIIDAGDYFSSTLDANCEDKEASIYASCAMYYMGLVQEEERARYFNLAEKAAYFALSWYYLWDVPFAPGQMLGDLGFKTRGWGNVSVENNHVDVYIFDFAHVLEALSGAGGNQRLALMSRVIRSSMRDQLMPEPGRLCGIAKTGYHPEVVQHTNWDYGHFGKGYYNNLFAPGWVVASLWEMLSGDRLEQYFMNP